jgi:hypothetical protein
MNLLTLFTGFDCGGRTFPKTSALSDSGICIYSASLEDPNVMPSQILRQRVITGHIEHDGRIYKKISDKIRGPENFEQAKHDTLYHFASRLGPKTELQLVVEETLDPGAITASFHIKTLVSATEPKVEHDFAHKHEPRFLFEAQRLWVGYFGVAEMREEIASRIKLAGCSDTSIEITSSRSSNPRLLPWIGKCSRALKDMLTWPEGVNGLVPIQGEWLLVDRKPGQVPGPCCVTVLRGSYMLLYSIICHLPLSSTIYLTFIGACWPCSIQPIIRVLRPLDLKYEPDLPVTVYSMMNNSSILIYELVSAMKRICDEPESRKRPMNEEESGKRSTKPRRRGRTRKQGYKSPELQMLSP